MAVFPETIDRINSDEVKASIKTIDSYIRYMCERIEFSMKNVTRVVSAAGVSSAEVYEMVTEQQQAVAALQSSVSSLSGSVTALQQSVNAISEKLGTFPSGSTSVAAQLASLDQRVSALEQ